MIPGPITLHKDQFSHDLHKILRTWRNIPVGELSPIWRVFAPQPADIRSTFITWLDQLAAIDPNGAQLLRDRFLVGKSILQLAHQSNQSKDQINRQQKQALSALANLAYPEVSGWLQAWLLQRSAHLNIPNTASLVGIEQHLSSLTEVVFQSGVPWVIEICGIGGIGKSSLAASLLKTGVHYPLFEHFIWIQTEQVIANIKSQTAVPTLFKILAAKLNLAPHSDPQQLEKAVCRHLHAHPALIVLDGLSETSSQPALIEQVTRCANPSKIILTSRRRSEGLLTIHTFLLSQLSFKPAQTLLDKQINHLEIHGDGIDQHFEQIYSLVGGNPLALKLVAGLLHTFPLPVVLTDLKKAHTSQTEKMYLHIYWQAWKSINQVSRKLLLCMPLVSKEGTHLQHLGQISQLGESELLSALIDLHHRSLIEQRGTLEKRLYSIHQLTDTFLQTEIIQWK